MPSSSRPQTQSSRPSNFQTRTATDDAGELNRRFTIIQTQGTPSPSERSARDDRQPSKHDPASNPYDPTTNESTPPPRRHSLSRKLLHLHDGHGDSGSPSGLSRRSGSARRRSRNIEPVPDDLLTTHDVSKNRKLNGEMSNPKPGLGPRPIGGHEKLGTFSGVFVPTCLNVLSILMFLRFGFILGQGGVLGIMGKSHWTILFQLRILIDLR